MSKQTDYRVPAAGYIRMSGDQQIDSPERQRAEINKQADRDGYRIVKWYEDHALTGTKSKNRHAFQQLLADAPKGLFRAVLVAELSRLSREDTLTALSHWKLLRDSRIDLVRCGKGLLDFDNMGDLLSGMVDCIGNHDESRKISGRASSGKRLNVERGEPISGPPFAYDRELYDEAGQVVRRVSFRERFNKPKTWSTKLVVSSDLVAVNAVRWAFDAVIRGVSLNAIAKEFDRRGIVGVLRRDRKRGVDRRPRPLNATNIKRILRNPVYCGQMSYGRFARGEYSRVIEDGTYVIRDGKHEPIIPPATFQLVQEILDLRYPKPESVTFGTYLLSGLIVCGHCGRKVHGATRKNQQRSSYRCDWGQHLAEWECPRPVILCEWVDTFVLQLLRKRLFAKPDRKLFSRAVQRQLRPDTSEADMQERELAELERKINVAEENLALAKDPADFAAIQAKLKPWRARRDELLKLDIAYDGKPTTEARALLRAFDQICESPVDADLPQLKHLVATTVEKVTLSKRVEMEPNGDEKTIVFGDVTFKEDVFDGPAFHYEFQARCGQPVYQRVAQFVLDQARPVLASTVAKHFGFTETRASVVLHMARKKGLIARRRKRGGWGQPDPQAKAG